MSDTDIAPGALENQPEPVVIEAPAVEVTVNVTETPVDENPAIETQPDTLVQDAGAEAAEGVAEIGAESEALTPALDAGNALVDESAEPSALESLEVERTEVEIEHARLENERMEIENEALRDQVEHAAEDQVQEVGVSSDGTARTDSEGQSETGRTERAGESASSGSDESGGKAKGDGGKSSAKSDTASEHRSSGREPRTRRFKRGS